MASIELNDEFAAALAAKAAAEGLSVQAYLEAVLLPAPSRPAPRLSLEEFEHLLDAEAEVSASPSGSFSRAELYSDHD